MKEITEEELLNKNNIGRCECIIQILKKEAKYITKEEKT